MKIFVILSRIPFPLEKGDKLRAYHQLRELKKEHEIVLCCLNDGRELTDAATLALNKICNELHIFNLKKWRIFANLCYSFINGKPFQVMYFYQRPIRKAISKLIAQVKPDSIYCQLIRTAEYAKNEHDYFKVLDYQDAFSKGMSRRKQKAKWPLKEVFGLESKRLIAYENIIFEYFESKTIISEEDRRFIYHPERKDIAIITNGIETDFFHPEFVLPKKYDLVFTGNMSYPPNIETAEFIVNEILPVLRTKGLKPTLLLAGSSPHKRVKALEKQDGVTISGWIDDIRSAYAEGHVFIAPMQIGTGLQNKLLESMSMGVPCITSPLANRALKAKDNQDLLVRSDIDGYVEAICSLLNNEELRNRIGRSGREFVKVNFSWGESVRKLEKCFSPS